jgi:hypothetical protein
MFTMLELAEQILRMTPASRLQDARIGPTGCRRIDPVPAAGPYILPPPPPLLENRGSAGRPR